MALDPVHRLNPLLMSPSSLFADIVGTDLQLSDTARRGWSATVRTRRRAVLLGLRDVLGVTALFALCVEPQCSVQGIHLFFIFGHHHLTRLEGATL